MRTDTVVVRGVSPQHAVQVRLPEHYHMIQAFTTNRADQALDIAVLPGRPWRGRMIADAHSSNAPDICRAECPVTIPDQMPWPFVPGKGFRYLTGNPLGSRIGGHAYPDQ